MPITTAFANQLKEDLWNGVHQPADVYKIALYTSAATLDKTTTAYSATNEASGTGYTAGGMNLVGRVVGASGDIRYLSFDDPVWPGATITARGCMIYNSTRSNKTLGVFDFGAEVTSTNGPFTVDLPAAGANAVLRLS
jgi:hypothetical protein